MNPSESETAASWIQRIDAGDKAALKSLYEAYHRQLLGFALKVCGNRLEAEEVVQDLFVRVWQQAGQYDAKRSTPVGWLFMMTRSMALDRRRKQRGVRENEEFVEPNVLAATLSEQGRSVVEPPVFAQEMIDSWFSHLSDEQRRCLEMTVLEGYTQAEASEVLKQPLGTVKSSIRRGLQRLRSYVLKEQLP